MNSSGLNLIQKFKRSVLALALFGVLLPAASSFAAAGTDATPSVHKAFPAPPRDYVYDEKSVLSPTAHQRLSEALAREDQTYGNQILVAIFDSIENEEPVDYTNRLYQAWHPGEKSKSNGLLLAAYLKEHKIRIEVGYGLEGVITDAVSKNVILDEIAPAFRQQRYDQGVLSGVGALLQRIHGKGEVSEPRKQGGAPIRVKPGLLMIFLILIYLIFSFIDRITSIGRGGSSGFIRRSPGIWFGGFGGGGGGGWGGGSGGGGFSGGGGSSGGGGASGDW